MRDELAIWSLKESSTVWTRFAIPRRNPFKIKNFFLARAAMAMERNQAAEDVVSVEG